jgi:hypothetical protein
MGIIVVGFALIGVVMFVLFGEFLHTVMEEPTERHAAPSVPETDETVGKPQAQSEIPDHL